MDFIYDDVVAWAILSKFQPVSSWAKSELRFEKFLRSRTTPTSSNSMLFSKSCTSRVSLLLMNKNDSACSTLCSLPQGLDATETGNCTTLTSTFRFLVSPAHSSS
jgi:hypothetical protein